VLNSRVGFSTIAILALSQAALADPATTLYVFPGPPGPGTPGGPIAVDPQGNIFGTGVGGPNDTSLVYELSPPQQAGGAWTGTIVYAFPETNDFVFATGVIRGGSGNLFGATYPDIKGCGNVFELKKTETGWRFRLLHNFANSGAEGCNPNGLAVAGSDTLFGVTSRGGSAKQGGVFQLSPPAGTSKVWTSSVIWTFDMPVDGAFPGSPILRDQAGDLFGTNEEGGPNGAGTVWELLPPSVGGSPWTRKVLWSFCGPDGKIPLGRLALDDAGDIYRICNQGGDSPHKGYGVVFKLAPPVNGSAVWSETTLHSFNATVPRRGNVSTGVVLAPNGELVFVSGFRVAALKSPHTGQPAWTLHQFATLPDFSTTPPVLGHHGAITGTSQSGTGNFGTVWRAGGP
jgi:hypothetical protein